MTSTKSKTIWRQSNGLPSSFKFKRRALIACLIAIMICSSVFVEANWPATASVSTAITYLKDNYSTYSQTRIYRPVIGPVSKNLYLLYSLISGSYDCAIRKLDASNNLVWQTGYGLVPAPKGMRIDSNEQNIYLERLATTLTVLRLSASDGSISSQVTL